MKCLLRANVCDFLGSNSRTMTGRKLSISAAITCQTLQIFTQSEEGMFDIHVVVLFIFVDRGQASKLAKN